MTLTKLIRYDLVESRPTLVTRVFCDHLNQPRAESWPDQLSLTRSQAVHVIIALQDALRDMGPSAPPASRIPPSVMTPPQPCSPAN